MAKSWDTPKDPDELLDYQIDWTSLLAGDVITVSTWSVPPGVIGGQESKTDSITTIWLSGGTAGQNYNIVNRINTAAGRIREQTCTLRCRTK
jgi:hypothetical protein